MTATTCYKCRYWDRGDDDDLGLCWLIGDPSGRCTDGVIEKPRLTGKLDGCVYGAKRTQEVAE